jgi:hypothetical protein
MTIVLSAVAVFCLLVMLLEATKDWDDDGVRHRE